jgi:ABC-2 type transport system ATP-binding protein
MYRIARHGNTRFPGLIGVGLSGKDSSRRLSGYAATARDAQYKDPGSPAAAKAENFRRERRPSVRQDTEVVVVRAQVAALDELVVRLVHAGIAVRKPAPPGVPLEAAFLALTEQQKAGR